jgi:hypothetical protein
MHINKYFFKLDSATKFFNCFYIHGWFYHPNDELVDIKLKINNSSLIIKNNDKSPPPQLLSQISKVRQEHEGVKKDLGSNRGFFLQALFSEQVPWQNLSLIFFTKNSEHIVAEVEKLNLERISEFSTPFLLNDFKKFLKKKNKPNILDIGGRDRSKLDRSKDFPNTNYDVLDILPGNNVNIVGDAHQLTKYCNHNFYDGIYCVSVFEHLIMPWKVVIEMNKVLKMGGLALIHTHQTLGMHDLPWDFLRFSSDSWPGFFNKKTGFKILKSAMDSEQYVLPFFIRNDKETAEKSCGYEGSTVLVEKINDTELIWPINTSEILETMYPSSEDGNLG